MKKLVRLCICFILQFLTHVCLLQTETLLEKCPDVAWSTSPCCSCEALQGRNHPDLKQIWLVHFWVRLPLGSSYQQRKQTGEECAPACYHLLSVSSVFTWQFRWSVQVQELRSLEKMVHFKIGHTKTRNCDNLQGLPFLLFCRMRKGHHTSTLMWHNMDPCVKGQ